MNSQSRIAIRIRCGARGGRCGRQLGIAQVVSPKDSSKPVMYLSNEGWATGAGYPLLEDAIRGDFSGSTGIFQCPAHGFLITGRSDDPPIAPGFPRGKWAQGISVQFPLSLLRGPYREYLRTGGMRTVKWVPGASPTIYSGG
jgi:hypothetical protein